MDKFIIKYEEGFTEHLYDALVTYCNGKIENGQEWYSYTENTYNDFKEKGYFKCWGSISKPQFCGVDNNPYGGIPTIVMSDLKAVINYRPLAVDYPKEFSYKYSTGPIKIKRSEWYKYNEGGSEFSNSPMLRHGKIHEGEKCEIVDFFKGHYLIEYATQNHTVRLFWKEDQLERVETVKEAPKALIRYNLNDWCYILDKDFIIDLEVNRIYKINNTQGTIYHFDSGDGEKDSAHWLEAKHFRLATAEDFLKEARLRYPVGTVYDNAGSVRTVQDPRKFYIYKRSPIEIAGAPGENMLFQHGVWSKVVTPPITKEAGLSDFAESVIRQAKFLFPIGTIVKSLAGYVDTIKGFISKTPEYPNGWDEHGQRLWFQGNEYNMLIYEKDRWAEVIEPVEVKSKGFDEAEFLNRPFNQISPIQTSSQIKQKQKSVWQK